MWQILQRLHLLKDKLVSSRNKKIFFAELIGTFTVIVFATGSVVLDAKLNGALGLPFMAIAPAIAVAIGIYLFGDTSMAHFNPAVTVAFLITKHLERKKGLLLIYLLAEILGGILASFFIYFIFGNEMNLGANAPNYTDFPIYVIIGSRNICICFTNVSSSDSSLYKRIKEIWRTINWCYSGFRCLFVWINFWCFNESCPFFGTCCCIWLLY